jgi:hypothetical protein
MAGFVLYVKKEFRKCNLFLKNGGVLNSDTVVPPLATAPEIENSPEKTT